MLYCMALDHFIASGQGGSSLLPELSGNYVHPFPEQIRRLFP